MKNRVYLVIISQILGILTVFSQQITVTGTVNGSNGEPLIGAVVQVKGSTVGTATDINGAYSISVDKSEILRVSYIGYESKDVIASSNRINIVLQASDQQLDDVIVVAYGTASKAGYTGSASTVTKKSIENAQVSNVSRLLQGAASGVQSIASSGQPGSDANVFIRGIGSINASSNPLYIVDGAPFDGNLNSINPSDIESINVLKDAASTALYGSRAANGLIIITTKQGAKNQKAKVEARFTYGISKRAVDDYKQVSTNDYFQMYWEAMRNQQYYINGKSSADAAAYASGNIISVLGINPYGTAYPSPVGLDGQIVAGATPLWNDNWSKEYTQDAHRLEAVANISGGGEKSSYFFSLNYLDDEGIAIASNFKRYSGRLNFNTEIRKNIRFSTNISLSHSVQNAPQGEDSNLANSLNFARSVPGFYPIWERDRTTGAYVLDANDQRIYDYGFYRPSAVSPGYNHLGSSVYDFNKVERDIASLRGALEIDLYKGLTYKGSLNIDYTNKNDHNYANPMYGPESLKDIPGSVSKYNYKTTGFTGNNILTYTTSINDVHNIKGLIGQEYYEYNTTYFYGSRSGFPTGGLYEPVAASQLGSFSGQSDQYKLLSYFANAEYNYNRKYFGSASIRRDGSSRFSPKTRWGTFWSLGGSWRISEEDFLKDNNALSKLTLRASYGGQGNDNIAYYAYKALFSIKNNLGESGFVTSRLATPDLKWETNLNLNIGVDFGFFNDRLTGSVEYFNRRSKDLLFEIPKPLSTGYGSIPANVGAMENVGIEFSVTGRPIQTKDLKWDISLNATHYKNKITKLPNTTNGYIVSGTKLMKVGGSIYDFFMVEWAGIDPEDGLPQWYKTTDSRERVKTKNYNEANTDQSKIVKGSSLPDLVGGFNTNISFKDFELSALFAYSLGGKIFNQDKLSLLHNGSSAGRAFSTDMLDRWTPENRDTDYPRLQTTNSYAWTSTSTRFLVDASYLRMKNITLGYNLPKPLLSRIGIGNCKIFLQAENLFTVFGEQGLDPEQAVNGVSYFRYPAMKTASFGINLSL